jgi:hypothetical protein
VRPPQHQGLSKTSFAARFVIYNLLEYKKWNMIVIGWLSIEDMRKIKMLHAKASSCVGGASTILRNASWGVG